MTNQEKTKFYYADGTEEYKEIIGKLTYSDVGKDSPRSFPKKTIKRIEIGTAVNEIDEFSIKACIGLEEIIIPDSVTKIGRKAFSFLDSLRTLTIPDSVTYIGPKLFLCNEYIDEWKGYKSVLEYVKLPKDIEVIGEWMFQQCRKLESIEIPNKVKLIEHEAFRDCSGLTSINIPNSVKKINYQAFFACTNLESINIPSTVEFIGEGTFLGCAKLKSIDIPLLEIIEINTFGYCSSLTNIIIPDSVKTIKPVAFSNCENLESVIIGTSVENIEEEVFTNCGKLNSIISNANIAPNIKENTFTNIAQNGTLTIPQESTGYDEWLSKLPEGWEIIKK